MSNPLPVALATDDAILQQVVAGQADHSFFANDQAALTPVVIGVSGGADSLCLLHLLWRLSSHWRLALHVAHLDHALRPDSYADARFVQELADRWQLPFYPQRLQPGQLAGHPGGLEEAARQARYRFLCQTAINVTPTAKVPVVALAHHADDQAETLLWRLVRGSGLVGLGAMRWVSERREAGRVVRIVRPLLGVQRSEILVYLQKHGLAWREDASNHDLHFTRNRLRQQVLPLLRQFNPALVETLGRTAQILADESVRLERWDQQNLHALLVDPSGAHLTSGELPPRQMVLELTQLRALDRASQRGLLRQVWLHLTCHLRDVSFAALETVLDKVKYAEGASGPHPLPGGLAWSVVTVFPRGAPGESGRLCLSLHRADALPLQLTHPYLDESWRRTIGQVALPESGLVDLPGGWRLAVSCETPAQLPANWQRADDRWAAYLDADQALYPLLTTAQSGWRVAPLGLVGHHKQLGDLFTDAKIPLALRSGWPVVIDPTRNEPLWVCGLTIAHWARITQETRRVLVLRWRKQAAEESLLNKLSAGDWEIMRSSDSIETIS
jgi:tRNA(Ile)-lysidine synthase